ncbi:branched-chain amino acid ABC transporter permease [Clostridium sp. DL1XJH146]
MKIKFGEFIRQNKKFLIGLLIVIVFPLIFSLIGIPLKRSIMTLFNMAGIYIIVAIGYNLLLGFGGQISLGHAAFIGLGAYITANLSIRFDANFLVSMAVSVIITGLLGVVLGIPALRLEGNYLAIATLGFGVAMEHIFMEFEGLTGGFSGLTGVASPSIFGFEFGSRLSMYYFILFFIVLAIIIARNIINSKTGRALMALRDSEIAAESLGINIAKYKTIAFAVSAAYAGLAGSLWAFLFKAVYAQSFGTAVSLNLLAMVVIGGLGTISGSIIGAVLMIILPEYTKAIPLANSATIITGILLIVIVMYSPYGLVELYGRLKYKFKTRKKNNSKIEKKEA